MKLTVKGQVTIPKRLRNRYGLHPEKEVHFEETPHGLLIKPTATDRLTKLKAAIRRTKGSATVSSTEELMQLTRGDD